MTPIPFFTNRTAKFSPLIFFIRNYYEFMTFTASKAAYFFSARFFYSFFRLCFIINFAVMLFSATHTAINVIVACYFKNFMAYRTYFFHNDHCSNLLILKQQPEKFRLLADFFCLHFYLYSNFFDLPPPHIEIYNLFIYRYICHSLSILSRILRYSFIIYKTFQQRNVFTKTRVHKIILKRRSRLTPSFFV